jgi:hypothetical protein
LISIAYALALAAAPTPATAPAAGACTLLNLAACADAGALARDPAFQAALRQFVGRRVTGYLSTGGQAYGEAMAVLSGPADPVRRLRGLYLFTACADAACDDQGAVALRPDGELAAVAIVHSDCGELRHAGDCLAREVLSILRGPDDDLGVVDALSDWARRGIAARPVTPGAAIRDLDRVEVVALSGPETQAPPQPRATARAAPPVALPRNPTPSPAPAPAPPAAAAVRAAPVAPIAPITAKAEPAKPLIPAPRVQAQAPAAAPPAPVARIEPPKAESARAEPLPADAPVTAVEGVTAVARPQGPRIFTPMKVYLTLVRTEPRIAVIPPPPPPPAPKPPRNGWKWHSTPYDCRRPTPGRLAIGPVALDPLAATCRRWDDKASK